MLNQLRSVSSDLRGLARLAVEATVGITDMVEALHQAISRSAGTGKAPPAVGGRGLKGMVYGAIRALTQTMGSGVEVILAPLATPEDGSSSSPERDALLAALNGVMGDHLAATGNPLAITMGLRCQGTPLILERAQLAAAIPAPGPRLLLLIHGLCRNDRQWSQGGHDHASALARDLGCTPLYLRYNSGLHISTNGQALAELLETLVAQWPEPVDSLTILAHSMGGLLARSACHHASEEGQAWLGHLRHLVFLGTPHHGAPLERGGHWLERALGVSPFTIPLARLGQVRSAGITDLRHGNLLDGDWEGQDRFAHGKDHRTHVPLPAGVQCCAMAATTGKHAGSWKDLLLGDGLVSVDSALGRHRDPRRCLGFPEDRRWIGHGMNHLDLLSRPEAYEQIRRWLG